MLDLCHCTQSVSCTPRVITSLGQPLLFCPCPLDPEFIQTLTWRRPGLDNTITSPELAKLFIVHILQAQSPFPCTSNRGSEFISHFFCSLGKAIGTTLHFTSGYHPEGDGKTKQTNQTLEQYLQIYCNYQQDNWAELLPLAEFSFNNSPSTTTGVSPSFANKGYHPNLTVNSEIGLSSTQAQEYTSDLSKLHEFLCSEMTLVQKCYQGPTDARFQDRR